MNSRTRLHPRQRQRLLIGASALVVGLLAAAAPAEAQVARFKSALNIPQVTVPVTGGTPVTTRTIRMRDAIAQQAANRATLQSMRALVTQARSAAIAAVRPQPKDGLGIGGLNPAVTGPAPAAGDASGLATWQGAQLPTQSVSGDAYTVTVKQTDSRAILSWNSFDVGAKTTLQFDQKVNGVAQTDWIALNRVVDPNAAPSTILGKIKADGTVLVLNRNGVIFGNGAQVNTHSLLVSSLEIGNFAKEDTFSGQTGRFTGLTLAERNTAFLENGLLGPSNLPVSFVPMLTSSLSGSGSYIPSDPNSSFVGAVEGDVVIDRGAQLTAGSGGFLIVTAPNIANDGQLTAQQGQISLQAGRAISYTVSTGASTSADSDIRGLILRSTTETGGAVINSGLIEAPRSYISLGADLTGSVTNSGLISSTTSVSRNGTISLTAGTVILAGAADRTMAGGLSILADSSTETVPQGTADEPPVFKTSRIDIGGAYVASTVLGPSQGLFGPAKVDFGANSLLFAPGAIVSVGGRASETYTPENFSGLGHPALVADITVAAGATIDVGGIKDVTVEAARNTVTISPLKGNELRDTPTYRDVTTDGSFTLNGATVTIDPRKTGVRADGVKWIGSPLIEAGSAASQIGVGAAELMTKGGTVTFGVDVPISQVANPGLLSRVDIAAGATVDFSGGWVHYNAGTVQTTRLIAADGTIVDISEADPNASYIGIADGFEYVQSRFGISQTFTNRILAGQRIDPAYDEGRDAGALVVRASSATLDATLHGDAFAGQRQLLDGVLGSRNATIARDPRRLQATAAQLPSGGYVRIGAFSGSSGTALGGDILIAGQSGAGTDIAPGTTVLSDRQLSAAGLSALTLQTSGGVRFAADSDLTLADGGALSIDAGRSIRFGGTVTAHGGSIRARTYELGGNLIDSIFAQIGSVFTAADDARTAYRAEDAPALFDVIVDGTLDVSGLWSNDLLAVGGLPVGDAFVDGGTISLTVAPKVLVGLGDSLAGATYALDLSGDLILGDDALLNVSSGGYVDAAGRLHLDGKGGSVALVNQTIYASLSKVDPAIDTTSTTYLPIGGDNPSVAFTPYVDVNSGLVVRGGLVPLETRSQVRFSADNIRGFSFGGGGTFTLVAPDVDFSAGPGRAGAAHVGFDFLQRTGFGTLDLSAWHSRIFDGLLDGVDGASAFLDTTRFVVGNGETLNLSQALMPVIVDPATRNRLAALATGSDVTRAVTAAIPVDAFDQRAATLRLGGLTELTVEQGGTITGAAGAALVTPKLLNRGTIRITGGSILQRAVVPDVLLTRALGLTGEELGGAGFDAVLGGRVEGDGPPRYDEDALANAFNGGVQITNRTLFSRSGGDRTLYFLGALEAGVGLRLDAGSVTDLSGGAVYDPRAPILPDGRMLSRGTLYDGGPIRTSPGFFDAGEQLFAANPYGNGRFQVLRQGALTDYVRGTTALALDTVAGARLDISGGTARFDDLVGPQSYALADAWSNGGTLAVFGGGSIAGLAIDAHGGAAAATGGTIEWLAPTLVQTNAAGVPSLDRISADQVMGAGFSTFIARRSIGIEGGTALTLDKAFILTSAASPLAAQQETDFLVTARLLSDGAASIVAPYVRIASRSQNAPSALTTPAQSGSLTFSGKTIDLVGGVGFAVPGATNTDGTTAGATNFVASGDIRLIGTAPAIDQFSRAGLTGSVVSNGDLTFQAAQVYATSGTGNLQQRIEDQRNGTAFSTQTPFLVASLAANGTVRFASNGGAVPDAPLSAGSWVRVLGANIEQDGVLRAPLGLLELGSTTSQRLPGSLNFAPVTRKLTFGAGSVTSVSGSGLNVPYGQTTDLTEYYYLANVNAALTAAPVGQLNLAATAIDVGAGATMDGRGGGDVFAFEFVSGTGGSRDVLSRFNTDSFSSNGGFQYADARQVYAILPVAKAGLVAAYDPVYSADYGADGGDLYGGNAGRIVHLDAAPGVAAGDYLLLPAHYALLPGAMRLVENTGVEAPYAGGGTRLLDGSVIVGGTLGTAGTDLMESTRRSFTVQDAATFKRYSKLQTTSGTTNFTNLATKQGRVAPRSPIDAARFVIAPAQTFTVDGRFDGTVGTGGRGAQFDITATAIAIRDAVAAEPTPGSVTVTAGTIANLNANSLLIGGVRSDNPDGSTSLTVTARSVTIDDGVSLALPELLLAAAGSGSSVTVGEGASIVATGTLADQRSGAYVIGSGTGSADTTGIGAVLRVSNGPDRLFTRNFAAGLTETALSATSLSIGDGAVLSGAAVGLNSSGAVAFDDTATVTAKAIVYGSSAIGFGEGGLSAELAAQLAAADSLTLQSRRVITLGAALPAAFNTLSIDAPGIAAAGGDAVIVAKSVRLGNALADQGGCSVAAIGACGNGRSLTIEADTIALGAGTFRVYGFEGGVTLDAAKGITYSGKGALAIDDLASPAFTDLTLKTPFLVDASGTNTADLTSGGADYTFVTRGDVVIDGTGRTATAGGAPSAGSILAFGAQDQGVASLTLVNAQVRATAGVVNAFADGDIALSGNAGIAAPGFSTRIGATADALVATAGGGTINLVSRTGDVALAAGTSLTVDTGTGEAGTLNLIAARGTVQLGATLNGAIAAGKTRDASLTINAATITAADGSAWNFSTFVSEAGARFQGDLQIRRGSGDFVLAAGQVLKADSVKLVTNAGIVSVAGTIDTSGDSVAGLRISDSAYDKARVDGGAIGLYGADGVALAATARLSAGTSGYAAGDSRQAKGGDITLGIGSDSAAITLAAGAVIDVAAARTGERLVAQVVKDPQTLTQSVAYRLAAGDLGGTVTFRAPIVDGAVDLVQGGTVAGAREVTLDAFRRFDLDAIATAGLLSGVTRAADGSIHLDAAASGKPNFLADTATAGTLPDFIRNFAVRRKDGGSLTGFRLRPEAVLAATGTIALDSNLNLGAGTITDYAGAVRDGLMVASGLGPDAAGNPRYEVVAGKEGELLARYVDMTFRVGGSITGEAGIFSLRAGGNLQLANSISDGFFVFHDKTDADYISHQLGGGDRVFGAALVLNCAGGSGCDVTLPSYTEAGPNNPPADDELIRINLTRAVQGGQNTAIFVHSPYSASANSVAANGTGNGIGAADLFPLVGGVAPASSDLRLVAGADASLVDPLATDRSGRGTVTLAGEKSYDIVANPGTATIGGALQLGYDDGNGLQYAAAGSFLTGVFSDVADAATTGDFYTRVDWGSGTPLADATRNAAQTFFAGRRFITRGGQAIGVYAPLSEVTQFLAGEFGAAYAAAVAPTITVRTPPPVAYTQTKARYNPLVRTGDGNIQVAAAGDIDLVGSATVTYRSGEGFQTAGRNPLPPSAANAQVGGSAIYTAGTRLPRLGVSGSLTFAANPAAEKLDYIPSTQAVLDWSPVVAGNGGDLLIEAGRDVIGRRDVWSETFLERGIGFTSSLPGYEAQAATLDTANVGSADQRWRVGTVGLDTTIAVVPQLFSSGVGALAGGNLTVRAGRDVSDLVIALDNSVVTDRTGGARVLATSGAGSLSLTAGRDLLGSSIDIAQGTGLVSVGRTVTNAGSTITTGSFEPNQLVTDQRNLLRLRVSDATLSLSARGTVEIGAITALGAARSQASPIDLMFAAGLFSAAAGVDIATVDTLSLVNNRGTRVPFTEIAALGDAPSSLTGFVLPPSLALTSVSSDLVLGNRFASLLFPSTYGQLSLVAGGDIANFAIGMSDADPSDLPGAFSVGQFRNFAGTLLRDRGLGFLFGAVVQPAEDSVLRLIHNRNVTHRDDFTPSQVYAGGSITGGQLLFAETARVNAARDIYDVYIEGQNVRQSDVTTIVAGRDLGATTFVAPQDTALRGRPYVGVTNIVLGGPGALVVQAGRDLGPFLNSAEVGGTSYAGGIRTVGNENNPWLATTGADITALFGVAGGADYDALDATYLDPANLDRLDGDLFVQVADSAGNRTPDRTRFLYAPRLAQWLRSNAPEALTAALGSGALSASDSALATLAYAGYAKLYAAFKAQVPALQQRQFLVREVYFGEVAAPADPNGPSDQQYIRGYRAIQTLFPASAGYTDNLATFDTDPATVSADHPLGEPTKKLVNGEPARATRVLTGNVDLRLATIQTGRGGSVDILGPGGDFIAGSVVRTSEQAARKATPYNFNGVRNITNGFATSISISGIGSIPIGFEGVLSLRGGAIRSFTDGDFRLNQSRLFTLSGGDITMWSSNGDLNAGQGPKTASNFPPIVLRFTPNALGEVDSAGSVAGAGIAALAPTADTPPSRVTLLAPVGTVDAGDAGVRASGDVFVAAARVANADNFKVGGVSVGIPTTAVVAAPAVPNSAAAATAATAAQAGAQQRADSADRRSIIRVDVLGYIGGDCPSGKFDAQGKCVN